MFKNMADSLQGVREALAFAYKDSIIDDAEFAILYKENLSKEVFPYWKFNTFNLDEADETECKVQFRFAKADFFLLLRALRIPKRFECSQRTVCTGIEGLCILLK